MKKLLASFLAAIIGTFGIACIDQEARDQISFHSKQISELNLKYEELSNEFELNKAPQFEIGDTVEGVVYENNEIASSIKCYGIITEVQYNSVNSRYKLDVYIDGTLARKQKENEEYALICLDNYGIVEAHFFSTGYIEFNDFYVEEILMSQLQLETEQLKIDIDSREGPNTPWWPDIWPPT